MSVISDSRNALVAQYAQSPKAPLRLSETIALCLRTPACIDAQAAFLDGVSPNGNSLMDRGDVAKVIRVQAEKLNMPISGKVTNMDIARHVMRQQRRAGITVQRSGRLLLELEHKTETDGSGQAEVTE